MLRLNYFNMHKMETIYKAHGVIKTLYPESLGEALHNFRFYEYEDRSTFCVYADLKICELVHSKLGNLNSTFTHFSFWESLNSVTLPGARWQKAAGAAFPYARRVFTQYYHFMQNKYLGAVFWGVRVILGNNSGDSVVFLIIIQIFLHMFKPY